MVIPNPRCLLAAWTNQQSSYFCSTLFCLLLIITELLLRRRTSWRQHTESLALAISWITLSIFWSFFPVRTLIVPILHKWKLLFLLKFVDLKIIRPKFKSVCCQYLTPRQMCSSTRSSKTDSFSSPSWRINSKSSTTSCSFILLFFYFLKIFFHLLLLCRIECCYISYHKPQQALINGINTYT